MNSLITSSKASFKATEIIPFGRRVKYVAGGGIALAGLADAEIGVSLYLSGKDSVPIGGMCAVQLIRKPVMATAASAFADGATVQRCASGKVDDFGEGAAYGIALGAAVEDGDLVPVLPLVS